MHPKDLSITDFSYVLPPGRIAQFPLQERDQSKLLIYEEGKISEDIFANVANHLPENATLIFNDTKVIHARIIFRNENDASIEVFLLEPVSPNSDMQLAIFEHGECTWRCFVGNAKKWREENGVQRIDWPSMSPDINPIENVWHLLKMSLQKRKLTTCRSLKAAIH